MSAAGQAIQECVENRLQSDLLDRKLVAGIIGDSPSKYAKSPSIWNPTFQQVGLDAVYLPFDVMPHRLGALISKLRQWERFLGGNVAVPYKIAIMEHLDEIDEKARRIGAVNTIVRTEDGRLIGYNTDGKGAIDSLMVARPGSPAPFLPTLDGLNVLLLGAGGAARAVGFHLAESVGSGTITITNRTFEKARSLAREIGGVYHNTRAVEESVIPEIASRLKLIVNCTTKGQAGLMPLGDGRVTVLEPYSPLAPASPAVADRNEDTSESSIYRTWFKESLADIEGNHAVSAQIVLSFPPDAGLFDVIYAPLETTFLRQGRLAGLWTINGKGMNIFQAADAFFHKVCRSALESMGLYRRETYQRVVSAMYEVW